MILRKGVWITCCPCFGLSSRCRWTCSPVASAASLRQLEGFMCQWDALLAKKLWRNSVFAGKNEVICYQLLSKWTIVRREKLILSRGSNPSSWFIIGNSERAELASCLTFDFCMLVFLLWTKGWITWAVRHGEDGWMDGHTLTWRQLTCLSLNEQMTFSVSLKRPTRLERHEEERQNNKQVNMWLHTAAVQTQETQI